MCLNIEKFITAELGFDPVGKELVLAYSGGADSRALFFILLTLSSRLDFTLTVAHLDHGLREGSALELAEARELAAEYGLLCYGKRTEVAELCRERKVGAEEGGRLARREFFTELVTRGDAFLAACQEIPDNIDDEDQEQQRIAWECALKEQRERWIVTGHQLNDLAEDVLMRLVRGGGWPALGGMRGIDRGRRLLRPLLLTARADIEEFLESIMQTWLQDPMNEDLAYLRNRVRAEILPLFLRENPSFLDTCADLWRLASLDRKMFSGLMKSATTASTHDKDAGVITLPAAAIDEQPKAMRLRILKRALEILGDGQPLMPNLMALDAAWENKRSGALVQFPGGKTATVQKDAIIFRAGPEKTEQAQATGVSSTQP